ncbi:indian hedgehog protein-like [Gigantopelta aegis]|uniref:indian hedgehog protein-like n=1 Tax=Gigantopelta aegis TaxID=1735272 RepID=UPI001B88C349|nr:indian hedgehog protein-like [Gigantopelta aegis]
MHFYVVILVLLVLQVLFAVSSSADGNTTAKDDVCSCKGRHGYHIRFWMIKCKGRKRCQFGCFPGDAQLELDNGRLIKMEDLRPGHMVLTVQDGQRTFSEVRTFFKRQPKNNGTYRTLTTEQGNQVTMTDNHIIFVSSNNKSTSMEARFAISVKPGDYLFTTKGCQHGLCPEQVVQVSIGVNLGVYVPLTDSGTLVVDGMLASCYSFTNHDVEHFFTAPFRWFPWLLEPWLQDGHSPIMSSLEYLGEMFLPETMKMLD